MSEVELVKRLRGAQTDFWSHTRVERLGEAIDTITRLLKERDEARAELALAKEDADRTWNEFNELHRALGDTTRFLDPPDGGDVHPIEQAQRVREALDAAEAQVAALKKALSTIDGYMTNACISMAAGGTKAHATGILNEAVDIARAAIQAKEAGE